MSDLKESRFKKGQDIGKPGLNFKTIAASAAKKYGSKEAGNRVAGAIQKKILAKEEVQQLDEMSDAQMKTREHNVKAMKKNYGDFRKRYGDKAKSVMYATATKQAMKEEEQQDEEQNVEDMHYCAKHVFSDIFGEGLVLEGQHAEPNEDGQVDWYMVEFADGIRKIPTNKLEIMFAEYHMNHKKKKKMMEEDEVAEANDGNLANNYPPYDKVTKGDVVAGRLGKDQQGGKKKVWDRIGKNRGMK